MTYDQEQEFIRRQAMSLDPEMARPQGRATVSNKDFETCFGPAPSIEERFMFLFGAFFEPKGPNENPVISFSKEEDASK